MGGSLHVKTQFGDEKVDQIRKYSGHKYTVVNEVYAGDICAVKGLKAIQAGSGLGFEEHAFQPHLTPYMNYRLFCHQIVIVFKPCLSYVNYLKKIQNCI